ncbi:MAG: hypothetical protein ACRD4F_19270, partial [Candidatus Angelobacter sp.]
MGRIWQRLGLAVLLVVQVGGLLAQERPGGLLRIYEDNIRLRLLPSTQLDLPFVNSSDRVLEGALLLELVNSHGVVAASRSGTFREEPGTTV